MKSDKPIIVFIILGSLIILFIILPLATTLFSTTILEVQQALFDREVIRSLGLTFAASGISTAIALLGGIPLAYIMSRYHFPGKTLIEAIINLPVVIPHTAAGIALLMVFGRNGIIGGVLGQLGLFFTDNLGGIVVAMLFVSLPFLINMGQEAFNLVDIELERAALTEGATSWQSFLYVTLPQAWRGIMAGVMMMWARGISEFGAVVIIAYHPKIIPILVFERFEGFGLNAAKPVAVVMIITVLIVFCVIRILFKPGKKQ